MNLLRGQRFDIKDEELLLGSIGDVHLTQADKFTEMVVDSRVNAVPVDGRCGKAGVINEVARDTGQQLIAFNGIEEFGLQGISINAWLNVGCGMTAEPEPTATQTVEQPIVLLVSFVLSFLFAFVV